MRSNDVRANRIEQWGILEVELPGPSGRQSVCRRRVDGDVRARTARSRRSPASTTATASIASASCRTRPGRWQYTTQSNVAGARRQDAASSTSVAPTGNNHGPVRVQQHVPLRLRRRHAVPAARHDLLRLDVTRATSSRSRRSRRSPRRHSTSCGCACFPKRYTWNENEPPLYPFEGTPPNKWDFTRFNPAFFQHLEKRIAQLRDLGIEADIILFHPYDEGHWGFDRMPAEADDRYLRYVVSRLAAFRNVWWSLANEYDFMTEKQESDWDRHDRGRARRRPVRPPDVDPQRPRALQPHEPAAHARQHSERLGRRGRGPGRAVSRRVSQADRVRRDQVRGRHSAALGQPVGRGDGAPLLGVHHRRHVSGPRRVLPAPVATCCGGRRAACCAARARRGSRSCATSWRRRRPTGSSRSTSGKCRTWPASRASTTSSTSAPSRPRSGSFNCRGASETTRTSWPAGCSSTSTCWTRGT